MYRKHLDQLTDEELLYCREFVALALIEQEETNSKDAARDSGDFDRYAGADGGLHEKPLVG